MESGAPETQLGCALPEPPISHAAHPCAASGVKVALNRRATKAHAGRLPAAGRDGVAEQHEPTLAQRMPRRLVREGEAGQGRQSGGAEHHQTATLDHGDSRHCRACAVGKAGPVSGRAIQRLVTADHEPGALVQRNRGAMSIE